MSVRAYINPLALPSTDYQLLTSLSSLAGSWDAFSLSFSLMSSSSACPAPTHNTSTSERRPNERQRGSKGWCLVADCQRLALGEPSVLTAAPLRNTSRASLAQSDSSSAGRGLKSVTAVTLLDVKRAVAARVRLFERGYQLLLSQVRDRLSERDRSADVTREAATSQYSDDGTHCLRRAFTTRVHCIRVCVLRGAVWSVGQSNCGDQRHK